LRISVIVPALHEEAGIVAAIKRAWEAGAAEVIVVDGGSHDQTVALCQAARCRLIQSSPGRGVQQNAGAAAAVGEVLLFLHADNQLAPGSVQQVVAAVEAGHRCGAFRQQIAATGWFYRALEWGNARRVIWWGLPYGDQGIFFCRALFEQLGGFPEVKLMEDLLLMRRARRRAWPVLLAGPLKVSPRRWQRHGPLRQTLRNWSLLLAWRCGVSTDRLADYYRRHDQTG
jgi:rSAM/selenodomain-associated transferase 2